LNFRRGAEDVNTFDDLARLRQREAGLVVAPHPFFPLGSCLRGCMNRHASLFDAAEINAMFTPTLNFNRPAERWAARYGKTLVGNGDIHRLRQLGSTYSVVDAEADPDAICAAIAAGRVRVESRPMPWSDIAYVLGGLMLGDIVRWWEARTRQTPTIGLR
jgi:hypothetical protein